MKAIATFLMIFDARVMNMLFIINVKIRVLIKWSYRSLQLCQPLSLEQFSYFEHIVQSFLNMCHFALCSRGHT